MAPNQKTPSERSDSSTRSPTRSTNGSKIRENSNDSAGTSGPRRGRTPLSSTHRFRTESLPPKFITSRRGKSGSNSEQDSALENPTISPVSEDLVLQTSVRIPVELKQSLDATSETEAAEIVSSTAANIPNFTTSTLSSQSRRASISQPSANYSAAAAPHPHQELRRVEKEEFDKAKSGLKPEEKAKLLTKESLENAMRVLGIELEDTVKDGDPQAENSFQERKGKERSTEDIARQVARGGSSVDTASPSLQPQPVQEAANKDAIVSTETYSQVPQYIVSAGKNDNEDGTESGKTASRTLQSSDHAEPAQFDTSLEQSITQELKAENNNLQQDDGKGQDKSTNSDNDVPEATPTNVARPSPLSRAQRTPSKSALKKARRKARAEAGRALAQEEAEVLNVASK
ncbi:hypothetical protein B0J14DRAFT_588894 [Halenospora varia]|nr:hypothetical protein B0J14DRAFT_588894 [Halenospora varia]